MPVFGYRRDATQKVRDLLRLLEAIKPTRLLRNADLQSYAERNGVSARTVRRDLKLLKEEGWLDYDRSNRAWTRTQQAEAFAVTSIQLSLEEVMALSLTRVLQGSSTHNGLDNTTTVDPFVTHHGERAFQRIFAALPSAMRERAAQVERAVRAAPAAPSTLRVPLPDFIAAVSQQDTLEILYDSYSGGKGSPAWRYVDPHEIQEDHDKRRFLLHGWCHQRHEIRTFALERVCAVRSPGIRFSRRDMEWEAFATACGIVGGLRGSAPVAVEVRFASEVTRYALSTRWSEGLQIAAQPDGSAVLTGTAQGTQGILREVLRWRRFAYVVGGPELRSAVLEELHAIQAQYEPLP